MTAAKPLCSSFPLDKSGGNVSRAAEQAGLNRRSLHRIIARLGIKNEDADVDD